MSIDATTADTAYRTQVAELTVRRVGVAATLMVLVAAADSVMAAFMEPLTVATFGHRLALFVISAAVLLMTRSPSAARHGFALAAVLVLTGTGDLAVQVMRTGGATSPYLHAGAVLIMFVGLFLPFSAREMAVVAAAMLAVLFGPLVYEHAARLASAKVDLFVTGVATICAIIAAHHVSAMRRRESRANLALRHEQQRAESLLLNILPRDIAARLKDEQRPLADGFAEVTILFADIVGFTSMSTRTSPDRIVGLLDEVFSRFDELTERYGLEKIKTIGDAYMVAGGLPAPRDDHAAAVADMALDMRSAIADVHDVSGAPLQIRIGINTGPVVAGVIGTKKFIYDLWGDAVNTAARMESHGEPGEIQITESTRDQLPERFQVESRGVIDVKGKGRIQTFFLRGRSETR